MLQIANDLVQAVASGALTLQEAVKFSGFLKAQRWAINEAEHKVGEEVEAEERRQYWEARRKEQAGSDEDS